MEFENNAYFWQKLDTLYMSCGVKIDRPKDSVHPLYSNLVYPVNYGYLDSGEPEELRIDVFEGSGGSLKVQAVVVCADILKKDVDVKLIVRCSAEEENRILQFLNQTDFQKTVIIRRGKNIPDWAVSN